MLATEIREGVATITPVKSACDFCELPTLCRIDQSLDDAEQGEEFENMGGGS